MIKLYLSAIFLMIHLCTVAKLDNTKILESLDEKINDRYLFKIEKDRRIASLKFSLDNTTDLEEKFEYSEDLYNEYKAFQYDSAYVYALKTKRYAQLCDNVQMEVKAQTNLLFCYATVGFFKEGAKIIDNFNPSDNISKNVLADFYLECVRYYQNLSIYVGMHTKLGIEYEQERQKYINLALSNLDPGDFNYRLNRAHEALNSGVDLKKSIEEILGLLEIKGISEHQKAVIYSWLSTAYELSGDSDSAIYYRAIAAISDIVSCVHETTSFRVLAQYLHDKGNSQRASTYIRLALEDANIYNSPFRKYELQNILPSIERENSDRLSRDKIILSVLSSAVVFLLIIVVIFYYKIISCNARLHIAHKELGVKAEELDMMNRKLHSINEILNESNKVKDQYIIQSLYGDSAFVDKVEAMCVLLQRKIKAKLYSDIDATVTKIGIKQERQRMANAFDSAFAKLYPNFIDEYNKLFPPDQASVLGENMELPSEVRVFALIKLGIEDINKISSYLNLSPNTIYAYKARVKAKTIIPKDEFEDRIKELCKH